MKLERTEARTIIAALTFLLVGVLFLVLGENVEGRWSSILALNVGAFLIASVVMALVFEFWQLRGLLEDLSAHIRGIDQLRAGGLTGFSVQFHDNVPWNELFVESNRLSIFVGYAGTWRNNHQSRLEKFLMDSGSQLEVVLPDCEAPLVMNELAVRFSMTVEDLKRKINEAEQFFIQLGKDGHGIVKVYRIKRAPTFTFYQFNTKVVFATYRHRPGRGTIVTLTAERGGELYEWLRNEWHGITVDGVTAGFTSLFFTNRLPSQSGT